jgi:hypothetical protein
MQELDLGSGIEKNRSLIFTHFYQLSDDLRFNLYEEFSYPICALTDLFYTLEKTFFEEFSYETNLY